MQGKLKIAGKTTKSIFLLKLTIIEGNMAHAMKLGQLFKKPAGGAAPAKPAAAAPAPAKPAAAATPSGVCISFYSLKPSKEIQIKFN